MSKEPRGLIWDIEATGLNATFGTILSIGYKWTDQKKVHVPTILDYPQKGILSDKELVREFAEVYNQADYTVAHYGTYYDLPMVQTKLLKHGLPPLAPVKMIDTWKVARYKLKLHNNRLNTLVEVLKTKAKKTDITFDDWIGAAAGDKKSLKRVVEHNYWDVLALEEVFHFVKPWITDLPAQRLFNGDPLSCDNCGAATLTKRGFYLTKANKYQRYQCQTCGAWQHDKKAIKLGAKP